MRVLTPSPYAVRPAGPKFQGGCPANLEAQRSRHSSNDTNFLDKVVIAIAGGLLLGAAVVGIVKKIVPDHPSTPPAVEQPLNQP